jgi:hypothetical protein
MKRRRRRVFTTKLCAGTAVLVLAWNCLSFRTRLDDPVISKSQQAPSSGAPTRDWYGSEEAFRDWYDREQRRWDGLDDLPRLMCLVPVAPMGDWRVKVAAVRDTWGADCDSLVFVLSNSTREQGTDLMHVPMSRSELGADGKPARHIWEKMWRALLVVYRHRLDEAEWFIKADLDTYLLVGNLKRYLAKRWAPTEPRYVGHVLRNQPADPMVAGSSSILSRRALQLLGPLLEGVATGGSPTCYDKPGVEEARVARCLRDVGVHPEDTIDGEGRATFLIYSPDFYVHTIRPKKDWWFYKNTLQTKWGEDCCSNHPNAFHKVDPRKTHAYLTGVVDSPPTKDPKAAAYWGRVREALGVRRTLPASEGHAQRASLDSFPGWYALSPIPHTIHLTWREKGVLRKYNDSAFIRNGVQNLIDLNPSWSWSISDDDDVERDLRQYLSVDDYKSVANRPIIEKTDLWRLLKIYHEGGYYQDFDMKYNLPMTEILDPDTRCVLPTYGNVNFRQDQMLCTAGSPFHKRAIELNLERRRKLVAKGRTTTAGDILFLGPQTYTDAIKQVLGLEKHASMEEARSAVNKLRPFAWAQKDILGGSAHNKTTYRLGARSLYHGGADKGSIQRHWTTMFKEPAEHKPQPLNHHIEMCTRTRYGEEYIVDWLSWYASQGVNHITLLVDDVNISGYERRVRNFPVGFVTIASAPMSGRLTNEHVWLSQCWTSAMATSENKTLYLLLADDDEYWVPAPRFGTKTIATVITQGDHPPCQHLCIRFFGNGGAKERTDLTVAQFLHRGKAVRHSWPGRSLVRVEAGVTTVTGLSDSPAHGPCPNNRSDAFEIHHYTRSRVEQDLRKNALWKESALWGEGGAIRSNLLKRQDRTEFLDNRAAAYVPLQRKWLAQHFPECDGDLKCMGVINRNPP